MRNLFLNLILFFFVLPCSAQDMKGWLIYFGNTKLKESKFSLHHELQLRDYKLMGDHNQTLIRIGAQYNVKKDLVATLGYGFIYTELEGSPNNPFIENRIYQEALYNHNVGRIKWRHRIRIEERFIEHQDFRGRFRYCLFADIPLSNKGFGKEGTYLAFYDELFINVSNDRIIKSFDRNRAYGGVGYKLTDNFAVQLGYMRQNVSEQSGTNHLLLSLHQTLKLN